MTQLDMEHGYWSFVIFSSFYWLLWWPFRELKIFGYMGIWISGKIMFCSHKSQRYSRAYIDFKNPEDVLEFAGFFHGHVFVNEKGTLVAYLLWIAWNFLAYHIFYLFVICYCLFWTDYIIDRERLILGESLKKCLFCFKKYKVFGVLIFDRF